MTISIKGIVVRYMVRADLSPLVSLLTRCIGLATILMIAGLVINIGMNFFFTAPERTAQGLISVDKAQAGWRGRPAVSPPCI